MTGAITGPHFPSGDKGNQVSTTPSQFLAFSVTIWLILGQSCLVCLLDLETQWADEAGKGQEAGRELSTKAESAGPRVLQAVFRAVTLGCEVLGLGFHICFCGAHVPSESCTSSDNRHSC